MSFPELNRVDLSKVNYVKRYSAASKNFIEDTSGVAASDWIPVQEGKLYTVSGAGLYCDADGPQGGYFSGHGSGKAVDNISFFDPVAGEGHVFQVPMGLGITHAVISLRKLNNSPSATQLAGYIQMEEGEMATAYLSYDSRNTANAALPADESSSGSAVIFDRTAWHRYTEGDVGQKWTGIWPNFRRHHHRKDKDLVVVNTGTSLTARTDEHCTDHPEKSYRPPLMHSHNMASILWDQMRWQDQQYRRYDAPSFFSETGQFHTATNLPEWDDGPYRAGYTRYSETTGASVSFVVPENAWQFNWIYRTDRVAVESVVISVAEGNGLMEVYDEATRSWVEADGYLFSMREPELSTRDVLIPLAASENALAEVNLASKGNTTYQKRLKMRCRGPSFDSRSSTKRVFISGQTAGRFLYWGVEWSPHQHMITYINAARGSHNTQAQHERGLPRFQDNEIWSFQPDLLFFELPIHNDGAGNAGAYAGGIWQRLTENFVFRKDYELSLVARGIHFGLSPEIGMFTSSISWNFGAMDEQGNLIETEQEDGTRMTALDKFNQAFDWVRLQHPDIVIIHAAKRWVEAGVAIFGNLKQATVGSGKAGTTFTNEGSHWNDTGSKMIAKVLAPLFETTDR